MSPFDPTRCDAVRLLASPDALLSFLGSEDPKVVLGARFVLHHLARGTFGDAVSSSLGLTVQRLAPSADDGLDALGVVPVVCGEG